MIKITSNQQEWATEFHKQIDLALAISNKTQLEASKELLKRIEDRTPVGDPSLWHSKAPPGYKPGTLRASWTLNIEETVSVVIATISNDQPYAERVEYGWSTQAPQGMVRISTKEWPSIVNQAALKNRL